jgi:hypothetical protein
MTETPKHSWPLRPLEPLIGTQCKCGAVVPMCGQHPDRPWRLVAGDWHCHTCASSQ